MTDANGTPTEGDPREEATGHGPVIRDKRRIDPEHYLDPKKRGEAMEVAGLSMVRDGLIDPDHYFGTINCDGVNSKGEVCGVTTTSGLAWKIPGRVGDSPILGAGLSLE